MAVIRNGENSTRNYSIFYCFYRNFIKTVIILLNIFACDLSLRNQMYFRNIFEFNLAKKYFELMGSLDRGDELTFHPKISQFLDNFYQETEVNHRLNYLYF